MDDVKMPFALIHGSNLQGNAVGFLQQDDLRILQCKAFATETARFRIGRGIDTCFLVLYLFYSFLCIRLWLIRREWFGWADVQESGIRYGSQLAQMQKAALNKKE